MIDATVTFLVSVMFSFMLVRALWKKEAVFGGPPGLVFAKKEKPIKYWLIVAMLFLAASLSLLMFVAQLRRMLSY